MSPVSAGGTGGVNEHLGQEFSQAVGPRVTRGDSLATPGQACDHGQRPLVRLLRLPEPALGHAVPGRDHFAETRQVGNYFFPPGVFFVRFRLQPVLLA